MILGTRVFSVLLRPPYYHLRLPILASIFPDDTDNDASNDASSSLSSVRLVVVHTFQDVSKRWERAGSKGPLVSRPFGLVGILRQVDDHPFLTSKCNPFSYPNPIVSCLLRDKGRLSEWVRARGGEATMTDSRRADQSNRSGLRSTHSALEPSYAQEHSWRRV